jgi:hypothetical protein
VRSNYVAFLSEVAVAFRDRVPLQDHVKDSFQYSNSFTGAEAIDVILAIMANKDRKIALAYGRALANQVRAPAASLNMA